MPAISFTGLLLVVAVAFVAPVLLEGAHLRRLPAVVVEIVAGILLGPSVLKWVQVDVPIQVLSVIGLAFLLFLGGLEVEFEHLKGRLLWMVGLGFACSFALALLVGFGVQAAGLIKAPLLVAIILVSTSLGVIIPVLKDAGENTSSFGQLVIAAASLADFGAIILLSLFFSREATNTATQLLLLGSFLLLTTALALAAFGLGHSGRLGRILQRLQDTTAQIRIRGAFVLLLAFVVLAQALGLEVILGAFAAGALLRFVDRDQMMTHPLFRQKLEAVGFGVFIPIFFVTSGLQFNLLALFSDLSAIFLVPLFLLALLLVRGLPALLYRRQLGPRRTLVAGLLQATSLPFIVAATQIGMELGLLRQTTGAALVAAGLLSVLLFPPSAVLLLRGSKLVPAVLLEQSAAERM